MKSAWIDVGVKSLMLPGEQECGDLHVFAPYRGGALLAAVDGVGHGPEAAAAARVATAVLEKHPGDSVLSLVRECHERMTWTRGAVMSLASVNAAERTLTWVGVGNVEGVLARADKNVSPPLESLLLRSGTVGGRLPSLSAAILPLSPGDVLVFGTDGIKGDFLGDAAFAGSAQETAERILERHRKETDDALVLVAQYLGVPA